MTLGAYHKPSEWARTARDPRERAHPKQVVAPHTYHGYTSEHIAPTLYFTVFFLSAVKSGTLI